ncbi:MAG: branched-chain amino acid ABC transporter permease [Acidimicrobiales bacterium]
MEQRGLTVHNFVVLFWPSTVGGITRGAIYALVALGYTLVYGVLQLINFAHSEVFMVGTFAALFTLHAAGISAAQSGLALVGVFLLMILAGIVGSSVTALVLERVAYRPLRRRTTSRLAALITAIGASFTLQEIFGLRYGRDKLVFPRVLNRHVLFHIGSAEVRNDMVVVVVAALVMMVALDRFVGSTRLGRGIRATSQDPQTAILMGVDIDRVIVVTFLLGGVMAGVAAGLYGLFFEVTQYNIGFLIGIKAFTAAVLGGIGNLRGALLGGFVLGLIESYGASIFGAKWQDVVAFAVLPLVLLFRPTGLLGEQLAKARS